MPDDRLHDAINLFKYSPTGQGVRTVDGPRAHQERYRTLARQVDAELWARWAADDIGFATLTRPGERIRNGESGRNAGRPDIQVNALFEPARDAYPTPLGQARLAITSLIMAHEAVHLVADWELVPEEILCRTLQALYFQDLLVPRSYRSRVTGSTLSAQLLPLDADLEVTFRDQEQRLEKLRLGQLVDNVLAVSTYRRTLTADLARDSVDWWGGARNRWPATRAMFLRVLAADFLRPGHDAAAGPLLARTLSAMTDYLEAFEGAATWQAGRWALGDIAAVRRVYASTDSRVSPGLLGQHRHALQVVQARIGETLL